MPRQFSGPALRQARLTAGLRPEHVAVAVGRAAWSISSYESGRGSPPAAVLVQLADLLDVKVDDLFTTGQEVTTP